MSDVRTLGKRLLAERDRVEDMAAAFVAIAHVEWYNRRLLCCKTNGVRPKVDDLTWPKHRKPPTLAEIASEINLFALFALFDDVQGVEFAAGDQYLAMRGRAIKAKGTAQDHLMTEVEAAGALWYRAFEAERAVGKLSTRSLGDDEPCDLVASATELAWDIYDLWRSLPEKSRPRCPWSEPVKKWLDKPEPVGLALHDKLILPRSVAQVEQDAPGYHLSRFQPAAHRTPSGQLLFGFEHETERGPTLPANIWALGLDGEKRGGVVSMALRMWVACILHTPLLARNGNHPVEIGRQGDDPLTLRKFLQWVYPGAWTDPDVRVPRAGEYWPRIRDACDAVNAAKVIYADDAGVLWGRQVVRMDTPYTRPPLDHRWPVVAHFPPGDGAGPLINFERLQHWSMRNPAAYRALINMAYRWHIPGKTLVPAPGRKKEYWLQRRDPKFYDRWSDLVRVAICYPPGYGAARWDQRVADADDTLEKLVKAGDALCVDGRLLPPPPG